MSAPVRSVKNSVCLNHPERPAVTRCDVCFKPICMECAKQGGTGTFCSEECAENYVRTRDGVGNWYAQSQRLAARRRRRRILTVIVLAGLGAGAYWYLGGTQGGLPEAKRRAADLIHMVRDILKP